jgi:hypothetical protein
LAIGVVNFLAIVISWVCKPTTEDVWDQQQSSSVLDTVAHLAKTSVAVRTSRRPAVT